MKRTLAICSALLAGASLGGCSGKKSEPAPSAEGARAPIAQVAAPDAPAPTDAAPIDAPPAPPVDPLAARFRRHYTADDALSERMQRRIRYHLRGQTKAPIALGQIIRVPQADGGVEVFGIYEYSVYEDCVLGYSTRKEGRAQCLGETVRITEQDPVGRPLEEDRPVRLNEQCVRLGVVRARFAPPGPQVPVDAGGAVTISSAQLVGTLCEVRGYDHLFAADLDGDERLELLIDVTTSEEKLNIEPSMRDVPEQRTIGHRFERYLYVFSGDSADGLALSSELGHWEDAAPPAQELVELRDVDGDRRLDVVQRELCFDHSVVAGQDPAQVCGHRPRRQTVYLYDAQKDAWISKEAKEASRVKGEQDKKDAQDAKASQEPAAGSAARP